MLIKSGLRQQDPPQIVAVCVRRDFDRIISVFKGR